MLSHRPVVTWLRPTSPDDATPKTPIRLPYGPWISVAGVQIEPPFAPGSASIGSSSKAGSPTGAE